MLQPTSLVVRTSPQSQPQQWVAHNDTTGEPFFSQDRNFAANNELIGTITFVNNNADKFLSIQNVTVIA